MKQKLTDKQQAFVREYLIDLNATQAAKRAGYKGNNLDKIGSELLSKTRVKAEIQVAMDKRAERTEINQDRVLGEIGKLAFADVRKLFDANGNLLPVHMLPDDIAASIASIEVVTTKLPGREPVEVEHTSKIRFWDKRGSLELLGKHLKLFVDRIEVDVGDELAARLKGARERAK